MLGLRGDLGISTVRTDCPRAAIASDKQAAVHRRAEAESRTYCTRERLVGSPVRELCTLFVLFSLYGAGAYQPLAKIPVNAVEGQPPATQPSGALRGGSMVTNRALLARCLTKA